MEYKYKDTLIKIYELSKNIEDITLNADIAKYVELITTNIAKNKGVYTVLVTLLVAKIVDPTQDIRKHQAKMPNGFSARTIDTAEITPTLRMLNLPSMAESGWLTRSLEQPYPYDMDYKGEISGKGMKNAFLMIIDYCQSKPHTSKSILRTILNGAINIRESNKIIISKIEYPDTNIDKIISLLAEHFTHKYGTHGASKLPVLAFYSIYTQLVQELTRYNGCMVKILDSNTASDRTSQKAGDIEIEREGKIFEAIEIKLDRIINEQTIKNIYDEKIKKFNPHRYYILSNIQPTFTNNIATLIQQIQIEHGCQLIVNGLIPTLKYYLRLLTDTKFFVNTYIECVKNDTELAIVHKQYLKILIEKHL